MDGPIIHVNDVYVSDLRHYGVKGMRWGVRKSNPSSGDYPASDDFIQKQSHKNRISKGGKKTLSNKELQELVTRMELEQKYSNLKGKEGNFQKIEKGHDRVKKIVGIAKTAQDIYNFVKSPLVQDIRKAFS